MPTEQELLSAKEQAEQEYKMPAGPARKAPGRVIGVGIGPKITRDKEVQNSRCVRFYVEKKIRPKEAIEGRFRIEPEYNGVPTDVIETGRVVSFEARPGSSLGLAPAPDQEELPPNVDPSRTGTLGAVVKIGGKYYVLGSNHAMAVNGRATGAQILFRPPDRFVDDPNDFVIARITNHVHLNQPGPNRVDCALAEIGEEYLERVTAEFPQPIVTSAAGIEPALGMKVALVDTSAQLKTGTVVSLSYQPRFDFSFGSYDFENLVLIESDYNEDNEPFARAGDSGALVVGLDEASEEYRATAIVMGGSRRKLENGQWKFYTVACPFKAALEELEKTLVNEGLLPSASKIELVFDLPRPAVKTAGLTDLPS